MQIVILAGGTGSLALQRGLFHLFEKRVDGANVKIIVNAYDNGRSTGSVRRVMNGRILGPSDVRKNQSVRRELTIPNSPWLHYLDHRFTSRATHARNLCMEQTGDLVENLNVGKQSALFEVLCSAIEEYFKSPTSSRIEYEDFALANIIYAGLAKANGNSLREASRIMARAMEIPDVVLLNDDESLFLGAITRSGHVIDDEGEIVCWGNARDPIVDVFFTDPGGNKTQPQLCFEAWQSIVDANLIVLSSGTQWSSLIPTYASVGFKAAIAQSRAEIVMVMNRVPDKDSPSQTSSDIINTLVPRYYDVGRLHVLADLNGHPALKTLDQLALEKVSTFTEADLSSAHDPADRHDAYKLAINIGYIYFKEYIKSDLYLFDYDDTLCGRDNAQPRSSQFNIGALADLNNCTNVSVCTGNSISALDLQGIRTRSEFNLRSRPLPIFADGGINKYLLVHHIAENGVDGELTVVECVAPNFLLPDSGPFSASSIATSLKRSGIPAWKIHIRGNALISIRPIEDSQRQALMNMIAHFLSDSDLQVRLSGRSTVEICRVGLSKVLALQHILTSFDKSQRMTYVGDEFTVGNDRDVAILAKRDPRILCLQIRDPAETAFFITTLTAKLLNNVRR